MATALLSNDLVRLRAVEEDDVEAFLLWEHDTGGLRQHNSGPVAHRGKRQLGELIRKLQDDPTTWAFAIVEQSTNRVVGEIGLDGAQWSHRNVGLGVSIGLPEDRARGLGGAAIELALQYAFDELNLHRVQMGVFSYNLDALRLYRRLGFVDEGAHREWGRRDGAPFDLVNLAMLEPEWRASRG